MSPTVSIVIRAKNEERFIDQTLRAVFEQEVDCPYEVILIDSGSTDRTLEIVRNHEVRLVEMQPHEFSFGRALNLGVKLSQGDIVINLSAHCIPTNTHWMRNLISPLLAGSASATFGKQEPIVGLNPFEEQQLLEDFSSECSNGSKVTFSNSNAAILKTVLTSYPFDEDVAFAEDFIWAKRLPASRVIQYVDSASVFHSHPLSFEYWKNRYYSSGLAERYIELVCGFQWPWSVPTRRARSDLLGSLTSGVKALLTETTDIISFLAKQGYYRYILVAPLFVFLRKYYYRKGTRTGTQLFA